MSLLSETLRALLSPARAVPLLSVVALIVVEQGRWSREPRAVPLALLLCATFVVVAPASWRRLAPLPGPPSPAGVVAYAALGAALVLLEGWALPGALGMGPTFITEAGGLTVLVGLFLVGGWGLGRDIEQEQKLEAASRRAADLEREAERAQLLAIKSHLDPHFLFNTLNAIAEWCRQDGEVAERATLTLSSMLRTILEGVQRPSWPLDDELALVRRLCELHAIRDPEMVKLEISIEGDASRVMIPPMLLLQVIENAIKHGPASGHRGPVSLAVRAAPGRVEIEARNPGEYRGERPGGQGLPTLRRRLALAYGDAARFSIEALPPGQTRCLLSLPASPSP